MSKLFKLIGAFTASVFLLLSITTSVSAEKKILFSIKGPGSGNPFWASVTKGAEEEAAKLGVKLILIAPPQEGDVQAQINQVEDQLAKGVDALALAPGDPNAFAPIVDDAIKSGVPVVFVDTKGINEGVTFIGTNNMNGAELAAKFICDKTPNIKAIFASNDNMGLGAMQALKDADMNDVIVVGFDATPDAATSILKGEMTATIAQFSYNMGAYGVKYALELANGGSIDPNIDTGTQLVTKENANDFK
jgi:ribose transport system substrate-binding protein